MIKKKSGFTLVETLVVVFISVLILGAILTVSMVSRWSLQTGSVLLDLQQEASRGMDKMLEELYIAGQSTVTIDNPDKEFVTFQAPTIYSETETIYKADGTINWGDGTNTDYKIKYLVPSVGQTNAGRLIRRVLDGGDNTVSETILANAIETISFTGYDTGASIDYTQPNSLVISIAVSKTTLQGRSLRTELSSQVTFRN